MKGVNTASAVHRSTWSEDGKTLRIGGLNGPSSWPEGVASEVAMRMTSGSPIWQAWSPDQIAEWVMLHDILTWGRNPYDKDGANAGIEQLWKEVRREP